MNICILHLFARASKLLLPALFTFLFCSFCFGQDKQITLPCSDLSCEEVFRHIHDQSGLTVALNMDKFDVNRRVRFAELTGSLDAVLDRVLSGTGSSYRISGRHILILPPSGEADSLSVPSPASADLHVNASDFEEDVKDYSNGNKVVTSREVNSVRYDTLVYTELPSGKFTYPSRSLIPEYTSRKVAGNKTYAVSRPPVFSLKTNLLYGLGTLTPNLSAEIGLGKRLSVDLFGSYNPWNLDGSYDDNKKLVHFILKPELRFWLCERFNGHFFGFHPFYWQYNVSRYDVPLLFDKEYRYQGNGFGAGVSYGYHWMWSKHWGMEFNVGFGVAFLDYVKKDCVKCGNKVGDYTDTYFGPTSAGIKLVYIIK